MDSLNHVKIVTPDPAAVDRFLREVLDIPAGWTIGEGPGDGPTREVATAREDDGSLTWESVGRFRGAGGGGGFIAGSSKSRQFQIFEGEKAHIWAVAVGTRNLEQAHQRCQEQGVACSEIRLVPWGEGSIRAFFAEVGGIVFEVLRVEAAAPS
ncbi:MAG TPA: VOC family protein [Acidimicrobiales bacterium]|nr:VOC family protein [Acidimicrobiales bacterium]